MNESATHREWNETTSEASESLLLRAVVALLRDLIILFFDCLNLHQGTRSVKHDPQIKHKTLRSFIFYLSRTMF
jgi:hypothetical protein